MLSSGFISQIVFHQLALRRHYARVTWRVLVIPLHHADGVTGQAFYDARMRMLATGLWLVMLARYARHAFSPPRG